MGIVLCVCAREFTWDLTLVFVNNVRNDYMPITVEFLADCLKFMQKTAPSEAEKGLALSMNLPAALCLPPTTPWLDSLGTPLVLI